MSAVSAESPGSGAAEAAPPTAGDDNAASTDFGPNEWLVDELYQRYQADPGSVDRAWWNFFADYHPKPPKQPRAAAAGPPAAAAPAPAATAAPGVAAPGVAAQAPAGPAAAAPARPASAGPGPAEAGPASASAPARPAPPAPVPVPASPAPATA